MKLPTLHTALTASALALVLLASGCLTAREKDLQTRFPTKHLFELDELPRLPEGQSHLFGEWDEGGEQSLCVMQLAAGAILRKQFHSRHDLTLVVVKGRGIVAIETTRYPVAPGDAVLLPRLSAYSVIPHDEDEEFVALMVYTPGFDDKDTTVVDD